MLPFHRAILQVHWVVEINTLLGTSMGTMEDLCGDGGAMLNPDALDVERVLTELRDTGIAAVPNIINEDFRQRLVAEADEHFASVSPAAVEVLHTNCTSRALSGFSWMFLKSWSSAYSSSVPSEFLILRGRFDAIS